MGDTVKIVPEEYNKALKEIQRGVVEDNRPGYKPELKSNFRGMVFLLANLKKLVLLLRTYDLFLSHDAEECIALGNNLEEIDEAYSRFLNGGGGV